MRKMKKIEPLVSVIMSTKDTEISMLKDSIDSILNLLLYVMEVKMIIIL